MTDSKKIHALLHENLSILEKAQAVLEQSYSVCKGIETPVTFDEFESVEAFTARFARTTDIFTQKVVPSLIVMLGEDMPTAIDRANFLEKLGIVDSADAYMDIRRLRNDISHDYVEDELIALFQTCKTHTSTLRAMIDATKQYIVQHIDTTSA